MNKIKTYRILQLVTFLLFWIIFSLIYYFYGGVEGVVGAVVVAGAVVVGAAAAAGVVVGAAGVVGAVAVVAGVVVAGGGAGVVVLIGALCEIFILAFLELKISEIKNE